MSDNIPTNNSSGSERKTEPRPVIQINRKIKRHAEEETHGTWKIAYADFVTAMMAFFVLMWLLSVTSVNEKTYEDQYFNPYAAEKSETSTPQGGVVAIFDGGMMGGSSLEKPLPEDQAGKVDPQDEVVDNPQERRRLTPKIDDIAVWRDQIQRFELETRELRETREEILGVLESIDRLQDLVDNVIVEEVPEGLRIQIIDRDGFSMFDSGSFDMTRRAQMLLTAIGMVLNELPNKIAISGHTDSVPYSGRDDYGNWELSTDRANAARRLLVSQDMTPSQITRVEGFAETQPLIDNNPNDPRNRRISLLVLRQHLISPDIKDIIDNWLEVRSNQ